MAFVLVQKRVSADTNDGAANSVSTQTLTSGLTAGNCLVGHVSWLAGDATLTSVADGTNTYTIDQTIGVDTNGIKSASFHLENIVAVASPVITASWAGAANQFRRIHVEEWSGVATTTALNKKTAQFQNGAFGTGTDACTSGTQTTTVDGCLIWGVAYDSSSTTLPSAGTGFISDDTATFAAGDCFRTESLTQGTQGLIASTFTSTAGGTDAIHVHMLALAPGAPTASPPPPGPFRMPQIRFIG